MMKTPDELRARYERAWEKPVLYIAGPMLSYGRPYVNVHDAVMAGEIAHARGWHPLLPQLNAFHEMAGARRSVEEWMEYDYVLVGMSDAVLFLPGSKQSTGAKEEAWLTEYLGKRTFWGIDELPDVNDR